MDIKQLKYFLAIADEEQITSAAKKLHMAQPPLSQQLKLLEEELGVKLVERGPRHIQLTDAGKILRTRARQILELSDYTVNEINDSIKGLKGTLTLGMVSTSGIMLLNDKITSFHKKYKGVKFSIHEGNTFKILDLLNKGVIEIGIVRTPFNKLNYGCKYMKLEPMIAVMTKEYYFEPSKTSITVEELQHKPLIFYRRFEQLINEVCMEKGFEPNITCKNDDARTTLLWASSGLGIGIVPESAFELINNKNLFYKKIESEKLMTQIAAIWIKDRYMSSIAKEFLDSFHE